MNINKKFITGLTLIEILVTMVVLSLGMLGLAGLQIAGLKGTDSAHYRTIATQLANDLAERIRTNPDGAATGSYVTDAANPIDCGASTSSTSSVDCNSEACSASELAQFDLYQIVCGQKTGRHKTGGVTNFLPNATLNVSCASPCVSSSPYTIRLNWYTRPDTVDQTADSYQDIVLRVVPD
jgi:type IV pilus assembly protein PilV